MARSACSPRTSRSLSSAAALAGALLAACTAPVIEDPTAAVVGAPELLAARPLVERGMPLPPLPDADVLGLDEPMRVFVAGRVDRSASPGRRLEQLLGAVIRDERFGVVYNHRTYTAAEAFRLREANCLSFTNMFIALAREAGLTVSYQEVDVPPDWTLSGDLMVLNRHVNVFVPGDHGADRVVDFDMADFDVAYDRRPVSDARGRAHFYSNRGASHLEAGDVAAALQYFRKALAEDPDFAPAWVNLGALYLRAGEPELARATWWHALRVAPGEIVAVSNLERLYRQEGRGEVADQLRRRIQHHRAQNPYYRYHLAQQAFDRGDYQVSIDHLRFAVRRKKNEDRFMALLGLSYLRLGDVDEARRWLTEAQAVADDERARSAYRGKLEWLAGRG